MKGLLSVSTILSLLALASAKSIYTDEHHRPVRPRDYDNRVYYAIELEDGVSPEAFSRSRGNDWEYEQKMGSLNNHYLFSVHKTSDAAQLVEGIKDRPAEQVMSDRRKLGKRALDRRSEKLVYKRAMIDDGLKALQVLETKILHKRMPPPVDSGMIPVQEAIKEFDIKDPEFSKQWHLINPVQPGNDLNITGVWKMGYTGKSKTAAVAVVDDGLDYENPDLADNYFAEGSYDFNDHRPNPRPELSDDRHGTRCAGEIAAVKNDKCGVGVAYEGQVAGIRILSGRISEADESLALNYAMDKNDIYSCSWGPPDDGVAIAEPGLAVRRAILNGVQNGRDKKGSIFVFASGNGGLLGDNCNFDGYTNSIYSITVAAIDRKGLHPGYSEQCSANMVVTYSSGSGDHIHTTDFHDGCTDGHGGTSAAAPIAAGIFQLVLEARPELTWRDMQYLAMDTAVVVNEDDGGWQKTFIGKQYNHKYGYGKLDAYRIVSRALEWEPVNPQAWHFHDRQVVNAPIANGDDKCAVSTVTVTQDELDAANVARLEHINVHLNVDHTRRGAIRVTLESPQGVVSNLMEPRFRDDSPDGLNGWTVMSVVHWGEPGAGNWTLKVCQPEHPDDQGTLKDWRLKLWGEAKDADKAMLFPNPEHDDPDPDHRPSTAPDYPATEPALAPGHKHTTTTTTSAAPTSEPTQEPSKPSEGGDDHEDDKQESGGDKDEGQGDKGETEDENGNGEDHWFYGPTFGLSNHTLAWIYGSLLLIIGFVGCITLYICVSRRKMRAGSSGSGGARYKRQNVAAYDFDLLPEDASDSDIDTDESDRRFLDHNDDDSVKESHEFQRITAGKKATTLYSAGGSASQSQADVIDDDDHEEDELLRN